MESQIIKGKKINMTQVFLDTGTLVPVTVVICSSDLNSELENKPVEVT